MLKLPKEQLDEVLRRNDLAYFAEDVLGFEVSKHHTEWSDLVSGHRRICVLASRDHGKSFFFSVAYAIWRAYYAWIPPLPSKEFKSFPRKPTGYIFSANQPNAIRILDEIKNEIETNPKLHWLKGPSPDSWSKAEIKTSNGAIIRARGWGVNVRGGHPAWAIADDVLDDESMYSEVRRMKDVEYFFSAITPMVIPNGQIIVVGTPFHSEDIYNVLRLNDSYQFGAFPALNETGDPLWPTRYSREMLDKKKAEVGSTRFSREYLVIPVSDEASLFPEKILKENYDFDCSLVSEMTNEISQNYDVFVGVDLAMSASVGADYTVITVIGVDKYKNRRLLDIRRFKGMQFRDQLREIESVFFQFRPQKIFIEDNQMQRIFADELIRYTDMPVEGFTTTAGHKNSLERGVPSLQILFENKKFIIPRKTERDRRITDILIGELKSFTFVNGKLQGLGSHDDTVMSLWIANECSQSSTFKFSFA